MENHRLLSMSSTYETLLTVKTMVALLQWMVLDRHCFADNEIGGLCHNTLFTVSGLVML